MSRDVYGAPHLQTGYTGDDESVPLKEHRGPPHSPGGKPAADNRGAAARPAGSGGAEGSGSGAGGGGSAEDYDTDPQAGGGAVRMKTAAPKPSHRGDGPKGGSR